MRAIRLWLLSPIAQADHGYGVGATCDATGGFVAKVSRQIQFGLKRIW